MERVQPAEPSHSDTNCRQVRLHFDNSDDKLSLTTMLIIVLAIMMTLTMISMMSMMTTQTYQVSMFFRLTSPPNFPVFSGEHYCDLLSPYRFNYDSCS